jgi:hypothetical protein
VLRLVRMVATVPARAGTPVLRERIDDSTIGDNPAAEGGGILSTLAHTNEDTGLGSASLGVRSALALGSAQALPHAPTCCQGEIDPMPKTRAGASV